MTPADRQAIRDRARVAGDSTYKLSDGRLLDATATLMRVDLDDLAADVLALDVALSETEAERDMEKNRWEHALILMEAAEKERNRAQTDLAACRMGMGEVEARVTELEAALRHYASESPCPDCDGTRTVFTDDGVENCDWCGATGFVETHAWDGGKVARAALADKEGT